jgi:1,2-phenylacetyl-CoA epoxidase PaaB subunit
MNEIYKVSYTVMAKMLPESVKDTPFRCEVTVLAEDAEHAIKRAKDASKHGVSRVSGVVRLCTLDIA